MKRPLESNQSKSTKNAKLKKAVVEALLQDDLHEALSSYPYARVEEQLPDGYFIGGRILFDGIQWDVHLRWGSSSGQGSYPMCLKVMDGKKDWTDEAESEVDGYAYFGDDKFQVRTFQCDGYNKQVVIFLSSPLRSKTIKTKYQGYAYPVRIVTLQQTVQ